MDNSENRIDDQGQMINIPSKIPVLALLEMVLYPSLAFPLYVGREVSIKAVNEALAEGNRVICLLTQRENKQVEHINPEDLYEVGVVAMILKMMKAPDGRVQLLVHGIARVEVEEIIQTEPYIEAKVHLLEEEDGDETETEALMRSVKKQLELAVEKGKFIPPEFLLMIMNIEKPGQLADMVATVLNLKTAERQEVLEILSVIERLRKVSVHLNQELQVLEVEGKIKNEVQKKLKKREKDYMLREQMDAIRKELGESDEKSEELREFQKRIKEKKLPEEALKAAEKELKRFSKMPSEAAEASVIRTYLDWILELPWMEGTDDNLDVVKAEEVLNKNHYGLDEVKERILEYLSVCKLKDVVKGPIICFVGPPGTGKTSLGRSIAEAMNRKFVRMSLGGIRDEAEIRGHRRTYIGALPGRIVQGIRTAGSRNPVFMLDEVDKIGADFRGDPSAALMEMLDPEQNTQFMDNYLAVPFDLSHVMFVCTANVLTTIPPALRDRMEILGLSGYTEDEKMEIARRYLVPKQVEENGLADAGVVFEDEAIQRVINEYTREAGLRNLERSLARVCRKLARALATDKEQDYTVSGEIVPEYLGVPKFRAEEERDRDEVGVAVGLAWTQNGGDVLFVEAAGMPGKGNLTLTGQLGDVMQESAKAGFTFARANADRYGLDPEFYSNLDMHLHVPEGAIPKDGPSAGITIATAMISALSKIPIRHDVAMTGEITLRGKVLPVGGLKSKLLAAKRAGVREVIVPAGNRPHIEDLPDHITEGLKLHFVEDVEKVFETALRHKKKKRKGRK